MTYPPDFEEFWAGYPVDGNMSKKMAYKQWERMAPEQRVKAMQSLYGFKRYCAENKWYRPVYAERYLVQERYEGFAAQRGPTQAEIEAAKDKADRLLKRGKYAEKFG